MRVEYPIKDINDENAAANVGSSNQFGFYPISRFNSWHGGYHVEGQNLEIGAIAEGKIIAYRMPKEYTKEIIGKETSYYSNGFVLIQHEYKSPKGQELTFFSLYMHLLAKDKKRAYQIVPSFLSKRPGLVKGLNARDTSKHVYFVIPKDEIVTLDSSPDNWDGNTKYKRVTFKDKHNMVWTGIHIAIDNKYVKAVGSNQYKIITEEDSGLAPESYSFNEEMKYDEIVSCNIPVKAGELIGYTGQYGFEKQPNYTASHIEVFTGDDVSSFLKDAKKDGETEKHFFKVKPGAVLKKAYPWKIPADSQIKVTEGESFSQVQLHSLTRTVLFSDITSMGKNAQDVTYYHVNGGTSFTNVNSAFQKMLKHDSDLVLVEMVVEDAVQKRKVIFYLPSDTKKYWVANGEIPGTDETRNLIADLSTIYEEKPDANRLQDTIAKEVIVSKKTFTTTKDPQGKVWYKLVIGDKSGWIKEEDPKLEKVSAYNWEAFGFDLKKDDQDLYLYDPESPPPFLSDVWARIDKDGSKILSTRELNNAFGDPEMSRKLSHLVCYHTSEWAWNDKWGTYKSTIKELFRKGIAEEDDGKLKKQLETKRDETLNALEARLKALCFWKEVKPVKAEKEEEEEVKEAPSKVERHWSPLDGIVAVKDETRTRFDTQPVPLGKDGLPIGDLKVFPRGNPLVYHFHPIAFVEQMRRMRRPNVIEIYHTGHISKVDLQDQATVSYEYYDKNGHVHDLGEFSIIMAQRWIKGAKEEGASGTWKKITIDGKTRYYLYDGDNKTPLIKPYFGASNVFYYNRTTLKIRMHAATSRPYHNPIAFGTIIGALAEGDFIDIVCNGSVGSDGTGAYSVSHINGFNTDFKYLRNDKKIAGIEALRILVNDPLLDIDRQNQFLNALNKFGWGVGTTNLSNKNKDGDDLNHSSSDPDHENHLHIQGFKPNYK